MWTPVGDVCPYLGGYDDSESYYAFPTDNNRCYTEKRPFRVELFHQENACLGQAFKEGQEILLKWQSAGQLPPDAYYEISVAYSHEGDTWHDEVPWTRDTSWRVSEHIYLLDLSDDGLHRWSVQVMRQTGVDADGNPTGEPISDRSAEWTPGGPGNLVTAAGQSRHPGIEQQQHRQTRSDHAAGLPIARGLGKHRS